MGPGIGQGRASGGAAGRGGAGPPGRAGPGRAAGQGRRAGPPGRAAGHRAAGRGRRAGRAGPGIGPPGGAAGRGRRAGPPGRAAQNVAHDGQAVITVKIVSARTTVPAHKSGRITRTYFTVAFDSFSKADIIELENRARYAQPANSLQSSQVSIVGICVYTLV